MNRHLSSVVILALAVLFASALPTPAATIGVIGNVSWQPTPGGGPATRLTGNHLVIDNSLNPIIRLDIAVVASQGDHQGVSQVVFDLVSPEAKQKGYFFNYINPEGNTGAFRANAGFNNTGFPAAHNISAPGYAPPIPCFEGFPNYQGGWGWTNSSLPHNGVTSGNAGTVAGVGDSLPLTWTGDYDPIAPGIQSEARVGIGLGINVAPLEDPNLGGQMLGFGADVANGVGGGDGSWWFHSILINTTNWDPQTYTFNMTTTAGNVLRSESDLTQPLGGGYRQAVTGADLFGGTFRLTLIPEPAFTVFLLGSLALIRRR